MININAYKVEDGKIQFGKPILIEVVAGGDVFCALTIEDTTVVARSDDIITAVQAAKKND